MIKRKHTGGDYDSVALYSDDERYRYMLIRRWHRTGIAPIFLMLNPSTATEEINDPTVARCCGFARSWGYGGVAVLNLFAWRATDPRELVAVPDPVGPDNDDTIRKACGLAKVPVVCAWGNHGRLLGRDLAVLAMLDELGVPTYALRVGKDGDPGHPLYLKADLQMQPYGLRKRRTT
jgi:hypothetical protein